MVVTQPPPTFGINVKDYGAKGNGSTDDTAAFQAAINAARGGKLFIPQPSENYPITDTLTIQPEGADTQVFLGIEMLGENGAIRFSGVNKPLFRSLGWKGSDVVGVKVATENTAKNAVVWDIDADGTYTSTSSVAFRNCLASLGTGGNNVGWRYGASGGNRDLSVLSLDTCQVTGQGRSYGDIAHQNMSQNGLGWIFTNPGVSGVHTGYTDTGVGVLLDGAINSSVQTIPFRTGVTDYPIEPLLSAGTVQIGSEKITYTGKTGTTITGCTRGANGTTAASHSDGDVIGQFVGSNRPAGGGSHTFINPVFSQTARDFQFGNGGAYSITGGRVEEGQKFIHQNGGTSRIDILTNNVTLSDYTPADEQVVRIQHPGMLDLGITATRPNGSIYTNAFVTFNFSNSYWLKYRLRGSVFGPNPAHTVSSGNVSYSPDAVILNSSNQPTGIFT